MIDTQVIWEHWEDLLGTRKQGKGAGHICPPPLPSPVSLEATGHPQGCCPFGDWSRWEEAEDTYKPPLLSGQERSKGTWGARSHPHQEKHSACFSCSPPPRAPAHQSACHPIW
jgi:hypothetical protein